MPIPHRSFKRNMAHPGLMLECSRPTGTVRERDRGYPRKETVVCHCQRPRGSSDKPPRASGPTARTDDAAADMASGSTCCGIFSTDVSSVAAQNHRVGELGL